MLVHYSHSKICLNDLHNVEQKDITAPFGKPRGLWVSVEGNNDGWREWCVSEEFNLENLKFVQQVHLQADAKVLWISTVEQFDVFNEMYTVVMGMGEGQRRYEYQSIDWKEVALTYAGIVIAPYFWSRRMERKSTWYYGWDCASGCIWDVSVIKQIDAGEAVVLAPPRASDDI